ncbi:FP2 [Symbiodinium necroappetens]|uniref:FP2 protein n=1 Tax=Symbiodinium necroappetens TaxID=1628268 RepID=A0A812K370_9DINO|nr:FP2 [Symbiodinium necroappetens]
MSSQACWQPVEIVGDTSEVGSDGVKWTPPTWYALTTIFASLSSHAAGILGFVGFQKIVMARIVSTSQPRANWSAPNFLLLTSIAISITAIFSSLMFMGVDYLRRLAIDSAWSRGYRLVVMRGRLERTGRGGFGAVYLHKVRQVSPDCEETSSVAPRSSGKLLVRYAFGLNPRVIRVCSILLELITSFSY